MDMYKVMMSGKRKPKSCGENSAPLSQRLLQMPYALSQNWTQPSMVENQQVTPSTSYGTASHFINELPPLWQESNTIF